MATDILEGLREGGRLADVEMARLRYEREAREAEEANFRATINDSGLSPLEFYVVVRLDPVEEKTAGGIFIPETVQAKDEVSAQEGTLIAVSPHAFDYAKWPDDEGPPEPGARVLFKRYDGHLHKRGGKTYKLLNDKSIIAVIEPAAVGIEEAA